jgi:tetratricopeptide (TPR) repeat protein
MVFFKISMNIIVLSLLLMACKQSDLELVDLSERCIANNNYNDGINACNKLLKRKKKMNIAYFNRGRCYLGLNNYQESLSDFNKALSLIPAGMQIVYNRNSPFAQIRDIATVSYSEVLFNRGQVYYFMDSLNKSFSDFTNCIELNEQKGLCYLWIGNIYLRLGRRKLACESYNQAMYLREEQASEFIEKYCPN